MHAPAAASPQVAASHHIDHPELLLLHTAVARVAERFITTQSLTAGQHEALLEYSADLDGLMPELAGPARDFALQLADLAHVVLEADAEARTQLADLAGATAAHWAA
jgi:hypothetical protein